MTREMKLHNRIVALEAEIRRLTAENDELRASVTRYGDEGALAALRDANARAEKAEAENAELRARVTRANNAESDAVEAMDRLGDLISSTNELTAEGIVALTFRGCMHGAHEDPALFGDRCPSCKWIAKDPTLLVQDRAEKAEAERDRLAATVARVRAVAKDWLALAPTTDDADHRFVNADDLDAALEADAAPAGYEK